MELAGAAMLWWVWSHFHLAEGEHRRRFLHDGILSDT
jgi:hypothetical protein